MAGPIQLIGFISKWVNARLIKFIGPTGENKIEIPDNLASALAITEGSNSYIKLDSRNGVEQIELAKDTTLHDNHVIEGFATSRNVIRSIRLKITPDGTPGTDISVDDISSTGYSFYAPIITDVTNLEKNETDGQWTLSADGTTITLN